MSVNTIKMPVFFIGLSYFFLLVTPLGWNMLIHLAPFYMMAFLCSLGNSNSRISVDKLIIPFLLYSLYSVISMAFIANLDGTSDKAIRCIFEGVILVFLSSYCFEHADIELINECAIIACVLIGVKMLFQGDVLADDVNRHIITNFGKPMDPNYLAAAFLYPALILFHRILQGRKRIVHIIVLIALVIVILSTGSRGALLSLFVGGVVIYFGEYRSLAHILTGVLILAVVVVAYQFLPDYFANRYSFGSLNNDNGSNFLRMNLWQTAFEIFQSNPVFGRGGNSMVNLGAEFGAYKSYMAHNTYLDTLADYGIIGGILFFGFLAAILTLSFKKRNGLVLGIMMATLVCSCVISAEHSAYFWQNIIMCIAMLRLDGRELNPRIKEKSLEISALQRDAAQ